MAQMAQEANSGPVGTPKPSTPSLKKSNSNTQSTKNQKTLHGFFQKTPNTGAATLPVNSSRNKGAPRKSFLSQTNSSHLTPAPSSDGLDEEQSAGDHDMEESAISKPRGLPSPISPANGIVDGQTNGGAEELTVYGTPSRRVMLLLIIPHDLC